MRDRRELAEIDMTYIWIGLIGSFRCMGVLIVTR